MSSSWLLLLSALIATALTGPAVHVVARGLAALSLVLLGWRHPRMAGVVVGGALLGLVGGVRQGGPAGSTSPSDGEVTAAWEVDERWTERSVRAWVLPHGGVARPVRLSGLPEELRAGARGYARMRMRALRGPRNPDDSDGRRRGLARGITARAWVAGDPLVLDTGRMSTVGRWRSAVLRRWQRGLPPPTHALWQALLLADRSGLDEGGALRLRRLGLSHLLALSGLHVGIVAGLLLVPLRRWGRRGLVAILPALLLWTAVAGAGPSLVRAVAMLGWMAVARRAGRPADPLQGLAKVALLDLWLRPASLLGVGWWLSYAATVAILRVLPAIAGWPRWAAGLSISAAAQAATAPWILATFGVLAPGAALVLLLVGPLFALVLGLGVLTLGAGLVVDLPVGVGRLLTLATHLFGAATALLEKASPELWGHPGIGGLAWAAALLAVGLVLPPWRGYARWRWMVAAGLVMGAHVGLLRPPAARWTTLDVGQGDAGVLRVGADVLVVDAGPRTPRWDAGERVVLPYLQRRNLRSVGLALTHGHLDHTGGADALLAEGRVSRLYLARCDSPRTWVQPLRQQALRAKTELVWLAAGDRVRQGGLVVDCLWPPADLAFDDANERSLVLRFQSGGETLLLTGDLERAAEARLLVEWPPGRVEMLKVAHHGGNTGTDGPWLDRLRPRWALLSCGTANRYGHPDPELLERLRARDVEILRTDQHGAIEVLWPADGQGVPRVRAVALGFLDAPQGRSYPPAVRRSRASRDIPRGPRPVRVSEQSGR